MYCIRRWPRLSCLILRQRSGFRQLCGSILYYQTGGLILGVEVSTLEHWVTPLLHHPFLGDTGPVVYYSPQTRRFNIGRKSKDCSFSADQPGNLVPLRVEGIASDPSKPLGLTIVRLIPRGIPKRVSQFSRSV